MRLLALIAVAGPWSTAAAQDGPPPASQEPAPPVAQQEDPPVAPHKESPADGAPPPAIDEEDSAAPGAAPPEGAPGTSPLSDLPSPAAQPEPVGDVSPSADEAEVETVATLRDQGIHYFRAGLMRPAEESLTGALKLPGGAEDYATHLYLARVRHGLDEIEQAHLEAQRALELASKPEEVAAAKELLEGLRGFYGEVNFLSAGPDAGPRRGFVILESSTRFISPKKKQAFARLRAERLDTATTLPLAVYLPRGEYTANGVPFSVVEGDTTEVFLGLRSSADAGAFPWVWVAGGAAAATAGLVAVFLLAPEPVAKKSLRVEGAF